MAVFVELDVGISLSDVVQDGVLGVIHRFLSLPAAVPSARGAKGDCDCGHRRRFVASPIFTPLKNNISDIARVNCNLFAILGQAEVKPSFFKLLGQ